MEKSNKDLIIEIAFVTIFLLIVVPVCVNASANFREAKLKAECSNNISINIATKNSNKIIEMTNLNKKPSKTKLILKITKYINEYAINLNDEIKKLNDMDHTEDDNNYYFNLGTYEVEKYNEVKFKLLLINNLVDSENITYSFITEEESC
ncbi:MAG: hypothetical protein IJI49_04990 [Bacilli bacterium]|nr:hypothetical protein [Bacilli bacterium]